MHLRNLVLYDAKRGAKVLIMCTAEREKGDLWLV